MVMSFHILQQKSPKKEKVGVKGTALLSCSKTPMLECSTQSSASPFTYFSHSNSLTECCVVPWFSLWFQLQSSRLLEALQTGLLVPFNPSAAYPEHFLPAQHPPLVTRHFYKLYASLNKAVLWNPERYNTFEALTALFSVNQRDLFFCHELAGT